MMMGEVKEVAKEQLLHEIQELKKEGYRFVTSTCVKVGDSVELTYHMDKDYVLKNIRITVPMTEKIDSISTLYPPAFLIENEFQDLFGIKFEGLSIDFGGHLYLTADAPTAPLADKK